MADVSQAVCQKGSVGHGNAPMVTSTETRSSDYREARRNELLVTREADEGAPLRDRRIVLVVPTFPKLSETFIVNKFLGLLERGWDAHVVCDSSDPAEWEKFPQLLQRADARARVHTGWPHQPRWLALLLMPLATVSALLGHPAAASRCVRAHGWKRLYLDAPILKLRPNLIHFEFGPLALDRIHLKHLLGCKVITSFRGYDLNFSGLDEPDYYQPVWDETDGLHLLGNDLWRRAQKRGCPPSKPHALIPPAIDWGFFDPGQRAHRDVAGGLERPLRILSVGRLEWKKGYEFALQAVRLLHERGVCFDYEIVGGGAYLEAVAFARHQMGLDHQVQLAGPLTAPQVKEKMGQADVFLHAAVSEGFCNAVLEAQAMMLPVVSSDADGLSENVAHGETGFVVPRRDPRALAEKLALLAGEPALRQSLAEAGRARVKAHFRLADQITAFDRLYRQVLSEGGTASPPGTPKTAHPRAEGQAER